MLVDKQGVACFLHLGDLREQEGVLGDRPALKARRRVHDAGRAAQAAGGDRRSCRTKYEGIEFATRFLKKITRRILIGGLKKCRAFHAAEIMEQSGDGTFPRA